MGKIAATVKTKVELSGEKEYKQALSEINGGLKVLKSEMELTAAQFDNTADSMDGLAKKNDVLERMISKQKDKVAVLEEALKNARLEYGETDRCTQQWQTSLNKAKAELENMEHELQDGTKQLENFNSGMKGLGDAVDDVTQKFGVNLPDGLKDGLNGIAEVNGAAFETIAAFAGIAAAVVEVEKALIDMTKEAAAAADEILTLSSQTGLATDTIQEMQYASELLDVDFSTIQGSMTKLTNNMQEAQQGSAKATAAFDALGVSVTNSDGTLRDAESVFYDVIDALGKFENGTERDAAAMDIFGKSAQDLNPLIQQGRDRLAELADEAHEVGYVMDDEMLDSLGGVDDSFQRLDKTWESAKNRLAAEFAPSLSAFADTASGAIGRLADNFADSGLVNIFGTLLELVGSLVPLIDVLAPAFEILGAVLQPVTWALGEVAKVITLITEGLSKIFNWIGDGLSNIFSPLFNLPSLIPGNAGGTVNWRGGLTWVGENGPELVSLPQGSQILNNQASRGTVGGDTFYITIDARSVEEFNDIVRIARNARMTTRMGVK